MPVVADSSELDRLERLIQTDGTPAEIYVTLRALQNDGLSAADLRVHVERFRAVNDASAQFDEDLEERCLTALDMIEGNVAGRSLRWGAAHVAKTYLGRILSPATLSAALPFALAASDLLPPRPSMQLTDGQAVSVVARVSRLLGSGEYRPGLADTFRVPKTSMTTRPAALLDPADRVVYEAMAQVVLPGVRSRLATSVFWPRDRSPDAADAAEAHRRYAVSPMGWDSDYVVVADVESFYETVVHRRIAAVLQRVALPTNPSFSPALELFLDAIMGSEVGLPQGPLASEVLATGFLSPIDRAIERTGAPYSRYADDMLLGCDSVQDSRRLIDALEEELARLDLRLSGTKTRVMKRATYIANLDRPVLLRAVDFETEQEHQATVGAIAPGPPDDEAESPAGLEDLIDDDEMERLYSGTADLDDAIATHRAHLDPERLQAHAERFSEAVAALASNDPRLKFTTVERLMRESLIYLAAGRYHIDLATLTRAVRWFPALAPYASGYMAAVSGRHANDVAAELGAWLTSSNESDWVVAWMANGAGRASPTTKTAVLPLLVAAAREGNPLTRASAAWTLHEAGALTDGLLASLEATLSRPLWADLFFGGIGVADAPRTAT